MANRMKKKALREANYNLSIDGLNSADADTLSRMLKLAAQAEGPSLGDGIGSGMDSDFGLGSTNDLMPGDDAMGADLIGGTPAGSMRGDLDAMDAADGMEDDPVVAVDPSVDDSGMDMGMGDEGVPGEIGPDPIEDPMDDDSEVFEDDLLEMTDKQKKYFGGKKDKADDDDDDDDNDDGNEEVEESRGPKSSGQEMREYSNMTDEEVDFDDGGNDSKNIMVQLRKVTALRNNPPMVQFDDGSTDAVPEKAARAVLNYFQKLRKPAEKENYMAMASASPDGLGDALMLAHGTMEEVDFRNRPKPHDYHLSGMDNIGGGKTDDERRVHARSGSNPLKTPEKLNEKSYRKLVNEFEKFSKNYKG